MRCALVWITQDGSEYVTLAMLVLVAKRYLIIFCKERLIYRRL